MKTLSRSITVAALFAALSSSVPFARANGGPFVVKYPSGDPAAKGVLARLDPDLKPARESRLRVVRENLRIVFTRADPASAIPLPLVYVSAEYTIENPTGAEIGIDFGFPILRGIYTHPFSMMPTPDVRVMIDGEGVPVDVISNSAIYAMIRQRARQATDRAIAADPALAHRIDVVRSAGFNGSLAPIADRGSEGPPGLPGPSRPASTASRPASTASRPARSSREESARRDLVVYLTSRKGWNKRDAALLCDYASLDFDSRRDFAPPDRSPFASLRASPNLESPVDSVGARFMAPDKDLLDANLGPLVAIGEQKATQFFAQLASRLDPKAAATYESIFAAWGGDVRERAIDFDTGKERPREIQIDPTDPAGAHRLSPFGSDPTVYARVDYLDSSLNLIPAEREACRSILKNLPVVFTFAPMNLLHYRTSFPSESTRRLTVAYRQYAFADTRSPASYQIAYVVHPALLWKRFGPIDLEVWSPEGVPVRASMPLAKRETAEPLTMAIVPDLSLGSKPERYIVHVATLTRKAGDLLCAVDGGVWGRFAPPRSTQPVIPGEGQSAPPTVPVTRSSPSVGRRIDER